MALLVIFLAFQRELIKNHKEALVIFVVTLFFALYLALGGWFFPKIEGPQEDANQKTVTQVLTNIKVKHPGISDAALDELFHQLSATGVKGLPKSGNPDIKWTFGNAVFYSITLLTTIGYGHLSPLTTTGKILTMVYTAIGIPLTLFMMSLYVCRLMSTSEAFKRYLFQKLKGPLTPVQISFMHVTTILVMILFGCFLIPSIIFVYLEHWNFLDALYYCFISLTTVGLGDYVPAVNASGPYVDLYRIGSGIFILYGVIIMMFMLAMTSDFYKHCHDDLTLPVSIHTEKAPLNATQISTYGAVRVEIPDEDNDQQRLLQT